MDELLAAASLEVPGELVQELTDFRPEMRREYLDFLKNRFAVSGNNDGGQILISD